jgi:hypothetical protein
MKESELNKIVNDKLNELDTLDTLHPSSDLNLKLMNRIATTSSSSKSSSIQFALVIILLITTNLGFLFTINKNNNHKALNRKGELSIVSKELLINPISINN